MTTKIGKSMRLKRVIDPAGVSVICALDHGMTSPTFFEPLADIEARTRETVAGGAVGRGGATAQRAVGRGVGDRVLKTDQPSISATRSWRLAARVRETRPGPRSTR